MDATKTTFHLLDSLRSRLKVLAARRGVTVTELLTEGASLVLARYQGSPERGELRRRAAAARKRLREGLYAGPPLADTIDNLVYDQKRADTGHTRRRK